MGLSIGEVFVDLGFNVDEVQLKKFDDGIKDLMGNIGRLVGVTGGFAGFGLMLNGAAETATQVRNLSTELGFNKVELEKWAAAWHVANPTSSFAEGLKVAAHAAQYLTQMQLGQGGNEAAFFGVTGADGDVTKMTARIKKNYKRAIEQWGVGVTSQKLAAIYGTADAINYLNLSQQQLAEAEANGPWSDQANEQLVRYNTSIANMINSFDQLKMKWIALPAEKIADFLNGKSTNSTGNPEDKYDNFSDYIDNEGFGAVLGHVFKRGFSAMGEGAGFLLNGYNSKDEREKYYREHGYWWAEPEAKGNGAAGILGRMGWDSDHINGALKRLNEESGLNPNAYGSGDEARGKKSEAYGIAQWHPDRQREFRKLMGHDIHGSSLEEQLQFMNYELTKGNERAAGDKFRKSKGRDAYASFTNDYERPAVKVDIHNNFPNNQNPQEAAAVVSQQVINTTHATTNLGSAY